MAIDFESLVVANPKRHADVSEDSRLFPYYAGYSSAFTSSLLQSSKLLKNSVVLDPWNGAGTTTQAAGELGLQGIGVDLNPAMAVVAKARLLSASEAPSLPPLAESIAVKCSSHASSEEVDALSLWLDPEGVMAVRALESATNKTLVSHGAYFPLTSRSVEHISPLASFFYVALFRTLRRLIQDFIPTNPTWVKTPTPQKRKRPRIGLVTALFVEEVRLLTASLVKKSSAIATEDMLVRILVGSSENLPLEPASADLVLTSPPYCTRIDYAVATAPELALLRFNASHFDTLRRSLMGTSTVAAVAGGCLAEWGATSAAFLDLVYKHPSKASKGYYYKSHLQYFGSLYKSIQELQRVLKPGGVCILVVQDSHYKEIHNDVPQVVCEMAHSVDLRFRRRNDFVADRSMVRMNKRARKYLRTRSHTESVLCFEK